MNDKIKGLVVGVTIGALLMSPSVFAASSKTVKASLQKINIYVDTNYKTNADAIIYNNTTYVPVRTISNSLSKGISLNGNDLYIGKQPIKKKITEDQAIDLLYKKIKKDADKYSLHFMTEEPEDNYYVFRVYEDFPDHIATYGYFYVDMYASNVYKYDIVNDKLVKL